ncbi:succinate dehydrogenase / fumarate reductase cytochrome b subunit [Kordia periserrulae]|uniref:Succinate dehydrogenase / fumarate reductase cytochrome b subunit n=1 Tax=Kordia periserrulae TaxID=701523 RepID=A0A2T6C6N2_9FLAO|nr:succinate dehydrogenase cytochrome b subunit [Kordia periserrulae]PTX63988.1 succinate dehydrogenase / fumarate reductase cytochrome b subunit [Kordia periserrulae]
MSGILNSSIGRKFAMALSALFLMVFLLQHFAINILSVFSENAFNEASHFMGTFWAVQFILQPILIIGIIFHFTMGIVLEIKNRKARQISYAKNNGAANSSWMSRNMIWTGLIIEGFLVVHMANIWWHEMMVKYINPQPVDATRYYEELVEHFQSPVIVGIYVVAFIFLALHLLHGFSSAFQSIGANNKYTRALKGFGKVYAIGIPAGFVFIALYHHFAH